MCSVGRSWVHWWGTQQQADVENFYNSQHRVAPMNAQRICLQDAARIQSATARANGGIVPAGSFAARAQAAAARNVRDGIVPDGGP